VRAWRGRRTQRGFSKRLGFASNGVGAWEAGRRWPSGATALLVARESGVDLAAALGRFHGVPPPWLAEVDPASRDGVARLLRELVGKTPLKRIAARSGLSRFAVSRFLKGQAEPQLPELLALVDAASGRVHELAAALADPELLPSVRHAREIVRERMELTRQDPWTPAVLAALCLHTYAARPHDDAWLAAELGVDEEIVKRSLERLAAAGQIRWDGARWDATPIFDQPAAEDPDFPRRMKDHWSRVGVERIPGRPGDLFSVNVLTASAADVERLRELHVAYFRAVAEVVGRSRGPFDRVVVVNTQLFALRRDS
jgi:DNA-binding phage protein